MTELLLFLAGILVGGMNAIAGGGMLLGFPVLLAAGLPPLVANATGHLVVLPGQLGAVFGYRKYLRRLPRQYLILLLPCLLGGALGAIILRHTPSSSFEQLVPGLVLFAVLLFALQPYLHFHLKTHMAKRSKKVKPIVLIALALLPVATYAGYFGPGFGFIMLAFLSFTKLHDIHKMNALKNLAGAAIVSTSIIFLWSAQLFNWRLGLAMALGNGIGGYAGSRLSLRFSTHAIRIIVIVIGFTAAAYLGFRNY